MNHNIDLIVGKIYTVNNKKSKSQHNYKHEKFTGKLIREYPYFYMFMCKNYTTCLNKAALVSGGYLVKEK